MADKEKDDMSLDDILTSIRSVVMDEGEEEAKKQPKQAKEPEPAPVQQPAPEPDVQPQQQSAPNNIEEIEQAIMNNSSVVNEDEIFKNIQQDIDEGKAIQDGGMENDNNIVPEKVEQPAELDDASVVISNSGQPMMTEHVNSAGKDAPDAVPLTEEDLQQTENTPDVIRDDIPTPLSDIMELGNPNAEKPMVSGRSAFNTEQSIKDILEILEEHKDELPEEFFDKQNEFIKTWLNGHLPQIVEKIVQKEITRIFDYVRKNK
ncbi:MAG: DUF2497 domain-containing protein [Alphaproteobacteria bacterium]